MSMEMLLGILGAIALLVLGTIIGMIKWGVNRVVAEFDELKKTVSEDKAKRIDRDRDLDSEIADLWNQGYKFFDHLQAMRFQGEKHNGWIFHAPWEPSRRREKGT